MSKAALISILILLLASTCGGLANWSELKPARGT